MNILFKKIENLSHLITLIIILAVSLPLYPGQKKNDAEQQFIKALDEKARETGNWKFINEDGWSITGDKDNGLILSQSGKCPQTTTLLSFAVINRWPDATRYILGKGGGINVTDSEGETPLHKAAYLGLTDFVTLLAEKGADVNLKNNDGMTPLHLSVFFTVYEAAAALLKKGADVNAVNNNGETPLFILKNYIINDSKSKKKMERLFTDRGGTDKLGKPSKGKSKKTDIPDSDAERFIADGIAMHNQGKYEEALKLFMRAKRISIGKEDISSEAYFRSAESTLALKDFGGALIDIDMAIYLKGPKCEYYKLREKINRASGKREDADGDLKKLKELKCGE